MANIFEKEIGKVYDGYWEVIGHRQEEGKDNMRITFRNIYNGKEIEMGQNSFRKLRRGELSISKFIYHTQFKHRSFSNFYEWKKARKGSCQL